MRVALTFVLCALTVRAPAADLPYAAEIGDSARVALLLAQGIPVDRPDNRGRTALIYAAAKGHLPIVRMLLDHGANVHAEGEFQLNAFNAAIDRGHLEIVRTLIQHGADIHLGDTKGLKPLILATEQGHTHIVALLLQHGADPNTRASNGVPALKIARDNGHNAIVEHLLNYGAAPDLPAIKKPPVTARPALDTLAIQKTLERGVDPPLALRLTVELGDTAMVRKLLNHGIDINARTSEGVTPLMAATGRGNLLMVQWLLHAGADPYAQDTSGHTALGYTRFVTDAQTRHDLQKLLHTTMSQRFIGR